ncbi:hypothetical protein E5198_03395 [Pseudomonas sp. A-1]|uniref:hypothetical protein n=1 Tax=Pseudomonas sp. A-1 TaxID=1821274 RepID=UPI0010A5ED24|nr:hypothetical protein [Pseudomonas sp. A-1]THG85723.1 hypothetical protein E5198_03395 [Pseudomonas sp. A-1]
MKGLSFAALGLAALCVALAGCMSIGPGTVERDRLDYSAAVGDSWKSQMLLNLVKLRYGDAPVFLDVGQIVAGYSFPRSLGAVAAVNQTDGAPVINSSVGLSAGATFNDSPTVTYAPMTGERFARSLMTPIPPSVILNIIQAGNPVEEVFRTSVQSVNGVDNRRVGRLFVRRANPEFYALLPNLERLQSSGDIGMRVRQEGGEAQLQMIFRPRTAAAEESARRNVATILGLDPEAREYQVSYGTVAGSDREIALLTRSIYEILVDIASFISVPEAHVAERRVRPTAEGDIGPSGAIPPLIRIASSAQQPADAFVAVPYQGYWFYIDNRDIPSKQVFSSIMFLFTFVETRSHEAAPILTIPTTR